MKTEKMTLVSGIDTGETTGQAVELLCRLIATPSPSREEQGVADIIEGWLDEMGFRVMRKFNNVWSRIDSGKDLPVVLLNSHLDTVRAVDGWTVDPFSPVISDGRITGLGSNDAGGPLTALLSCFVHFARQSGLPYNLIFAATAEEEISGSEGISGILEELGHVDLGIIGEPTGMKLAVAERGLMVIDCSARGRSAHAGHGGGKNAIYLAMSDLEWIRTFSFERTSQLLGPVQMQVTQINAGSQHNVVPDLCDFVIDVRSNDRYTNEEILMVIRENLASEARPRSLRLNASSISPEHPVVRKGVSIGLPCVGSGTLSDQALLPFPTVKIGPGDPARSHTADEFITLEEMGEGISKYIGLLDGLELNEETRQPSGR